MCWTGSRGSGSAGVSPTLGIFLNRQIAGKMSALQKTSGRCACACGAGCIILRALRLHSSADAAATGEDTCIAEAAKPHHFAPQCSF
jgi:hypothetical protein